MKTNSHKTRKWTTTTTPKFSLFPKSLALKNGKKELPRNSPNNSKKKLKADMAVNNPNKRAKTYLPQLQLLLKDSKTLLIIKMIVSVYQL